MKSKLFLLLFLFPVISNASDGVVLIPESAPYQDQNAIQGNVVSECSSLGAELSTHVADALTRSGVTVEKMPTLDVASGTVLDVKIVNLFSGGHPGAPVGMGGHHKSITVSVTLYKDNQAVGEGSFTRNSSGGFWGSFKSSCSVLDRVTITLGKDIANWYRTKQ
jgi:hypothetical protein